MKVAQSCPTVCDPTDYTVHGMLWARILEWVAFPFSRGSSQPRSPTLHADSLPAEPQGKPKNSGVGNLSLLQGIFAIQESNRGLLHCRWIFYQLSYHGSPEVHQAQPQIRASLGEKRVFGCFIKKFLIESQSILLQFLLNAFQILPNSFFISVI